MAGTDKLAEKLAAKKEELASLQQLQRQSQALVTELEQLAEKMSSMTSGTESVAEMMANWTQVLGALRMSEKSLLNYVQGQQGNIEQTEEGKPQLPGKLIRIPKD